MTRKCALLIVLAVYLSGCTMFSTSARPIALSTTPDGATATADGGMRDCITPCSLKLESHSNHSITFRKEGYQDESIALVSVDSGWLLRDVALRPMALLEFTHPEAYSLSSNSIEVVLTPLPTTSASFQVSQMAAESPQLEDTEKDQVQQYLNYQSSAWRQRELKFPLFGLLPSIRLGGSGGSAF